MATTVPNRRNTSLQSWSSVGYCGSRTLIESARGVSRASRDTYVRHSEKGSQHPIFRPSFERYRRSTNDRSEKYVGALDATGVEWWAGRPLSVPSEHGSRVVVTGATGFIGTHLIRRLQREHTPVLAIVRTSPSGQASERGVEYAVRDLERTDTLRDLLRSGDVVVHLAARVHIMRDSHPGSQDAYRRSNVELTRMLCRSAVESG